MSVNKRAIARHVTPPADLGDEAPELGDAFFDRADLLVGETVVRRGRPPGATKVSTTIRFDTDVLAALKGTGPGWQTRVNELVRAAMALKRA